MSHPATSKRSPEIRIVADAGAALRRANFERQAARRPSVALTARLAGTEMPSAVLQSFDGGSHDTANLSYGWVIYYYYSGVHAERPDGSDDSGQDAALHRAYRDQRDSFVALGIRVIGVSSESGAEQLTTIRDHQISHRMLIDPQCQYARLLNLPVVDIQGRARYRRLALLTRNRCIEHVFFPIEAPSRNAGQVLAWMRVHGAAPSS